METLKEINVDSIIETDSDLSAVRVLIDEYLNKAKNYQSQIKEMVEKAEKDFTSFVKEKCNFSFEALSTDEKIMDLSVLISNDRLHIRFYYDRKRNQSVEFYFDILSNYKFFDWEGNKRKEFLDKGLDLGDVYVIRFPQIGIDLSQKDIFEEELELFKLVPYVTNEFKDKHNKEGLFQKVKEFFVKYFELIYLHQEVCVKLSAMRSRCDMYTFNVQKDLVKQMDIFKKENFIVFFKKDSNFIKFDVFEIVIVSNKYITYNYHYSRIDKCYKSQPQKDGEHQPDEARYFQTIRNNKSNDKIVVDSFHNKVTTYLNKGDKMAVYNKDTWEDFKMLTETEVDNIFHSKVLDEDLKAISDVYEKLVNV